MYRYRPLRNPDDLKYLLDEIETNNVYLSKSEKLNDPFETQYLSSALSKEKYNAKKLLKTVKEITGEDYLYSIILDEISKNKYDYKMIVLEDFVNISFEYVNKAIKKKNKKLTITKQKYYRELIENTEKLYSTKISNILIASFSETWSSLPMWSYYASDYKGVCLEYDFTKLKTTSNKILSRMYKVSYSFDMPRNKYGLNYSPTVKSAEWSHENEWRCIVEQDDERIIKINGDNYIKVPYLSEIIVGARISSEYEKNIFLSKIKSTGKLKNVNIYVAELDKSKYKLNKRLIFGSK